MQLIPSPVFVWIFHKASQKKEEGIWKQEYGYKVTRIGRDKNLECVGFFWGEGVLFFFSFIFWSRLVKNILNNFCLAYLVPFID